MGNQITCSVDYKKPIVNINLKEIEPIHINAKPIIERITKPITIIKYVDQYGDITEDFGKIF